MKGEKYITKEGMRKYECQKAWLNTQGQKGKFIFIGHAILDHFQTKMFKCQTRIPNL